MKIALVHDFLTKIGGAEKVLSSFHDIYPEAPIYTLLYDQKSIKGLFNSPKPKIIASSLNRLPLIIRYDKKLLLGKYSQAIEEFSFAEYDVVISLSSTFAHGIITRPSTLHICYCFSPMRFVWDWHSEYLSEHKIGIGVKGLYIRNILHKLRIWDRIAAYRVDRWLAQSVTAQKRIAKYYQAEATIINPPVDTVKIQPSSSDPEDYFLIVSRLEPYKKIDLAIEAFNKIGRPLVIIGEGSDKFRLQKLSKNNIKFLGWQDEESVYESMKKSYAFIFPGEEDFGLTPVESMAAGRPVIAYGKGGVTETVINHKTGLFFNQVSSQALIEAVNNLSENYNDFSPENCRNQAEKFSKALFRQKITEFVEESYRSYFNK